MSAANAIDFDPVVPREFFMTQPSSASKAIIRKNLIEVLPVEQQLFSYDSANIIRFNVSNNTDFLDGPSSYLKFNLKRTDGVSDFDENAALDVGGAHALIRHATVRLLSSGMLVQEYRDYNRYYALKAQLDARSLSSGAQSYGDSAGDIGVFADPTRSGDWRAVSHTLASVNCNAAGLLELGSTGRALSEVAAGDIIYVLSTNANQTFMADVISVPDDSSIVLRFGKAITAHATTGLGTNGKIFVLKRHTVEQSRMTVVKTSGTEVTVCMKLNMSVLGHVLPLFLMKGGLEITLELENPNLALRTGVSPQYVGSDVLNYQVSKPRFMAMMVTPNIDITDEYIRAWRSDRGLIYNIPSMRSRRLTQDKSVSGISNFQINLGVKSGKRLYMVVQDTTISDGSGSMAKHSRSISRFLRSKITEYQVKVGSHAFPNRSVVCDTEALEALEQLKMVAKTPAFRFTKQEWLASNVGGTPTADETHTDSECFIMGIDFTREFPSVESSLTGVDLATVPLDVSLTRSDAHQACFSSPSTDAGSPQVGLYCEHDAFLKISSEQMVIMN